MWRVDSLEKTLMLEGLGAGGEGDDRGWDGWMASLTQWTWVWVISRSWWWTGRPGVLWFMGSQRVEHNWATELNWSELKLFFILLVKITSCVSDFQVFLNQCNIFNYSAPIKINTFIYKNYARNFRNSPTLLSLDFLSYQTKVLFVLMTVLR